jgi:heme exporter protein B
LVMGQPVSGDLFQWLKLLIGFDVIYTALALALVDIILVG